MQKAQRKPWHKRWHSQALHGYAALSLELRGAYTTFLDTMYDQGGPLRDEKWNVSAILGCDPRLSKRVRQTLIEACKLWTFTDADGVSWLGNDKVQETLLLPSYAELTGQLSDKLSIATGQLSDSASKKPKENSEPAKKAEGKKAPKKKEDRRKNPLPPEGVNEAVDLYNETASRLGIPKALGLNPKRSEHIAARLAEHGLDGWRLALSALSRESFYRGQNDRGWKADIDYVARPSGFLKLLERAPIQLPQAANAEPVDPWRSRMEGHKASNHWRSTEWGPRPGQPGCMVPVELLTEYGFQELAA